MAHKLEITVLSAEDLRINRKLVKKNVFVCLQSPESGRPDETWTTGMESEGGSHPKWNEKVEMEVPVHARFITAEVREKGTMGCVTSIGMARIPVSDFMGNYLPESRVHFLSYRLWDRKCSKNGVINVSVRVKFSEQHCRTVKGVPVGNSDCSGVVRGIPVWLNNYPAKL
ncbi:BON1-associated protein 2-like [Neltuma alba]|uniref:BON1-associated protein 2-like n=1 Tax=Neltuma alba TaxID=207710 RepID=UPI0010A3629E|nr:BON1-associated protein 2-like [Prosopis alba]XP_028787385.1 BON1-associated protein 2-like [Prosopis alba]